ncbi:hypothetical protein K492DRAFT_215133 [Lichtheimia hyalospora FSU 10163]|nr:hypothetical protein K492DRAFT_215133 [Lichtheimia hyalospora FSU 10163]
MSELTNLAQVKHGIYTHLAQLQSACWKYWDIDVPSALFERKEIENRRERERINTNLMGWWGPAKGVPLMVFVAADVTIPHADKITRSKLSVAMKRMQEVVQARVKNIFRAFHLIPLAEGGSGREPVEVRSLFALPTTTQPFVHVVPSTPFAAISSFSDSNNMDTFSFDRPVSISTWLRDNNDDNTEGFNNKRKDTKQQTTESILDDCGNKLLRNFVAHWVRAATTRHPMHLQMITSSGPRKGGESKQSIPLPNGLQFASALLVLRSLLFGPSAKDEMDDGDFRKGVIASSPGARGMIQQIEVILRKKIRDTVEIERVFSKSHSLEIMRKCVETYLQDSPPCYTRQYHLWKRENVLRLYATLSRGPCAAEFATRLERECDLIWKQGRQSCEKISLTGRVCRLKAGHENADQEHVIKHTRDMDGTKHSSGCSFFHACTCGKVQKLREDPFDLEEANISFYSRFTCCLAEGRMAIDIQKSNFGVQEEQQLYTDNEHIPHYESALLYLGPASVYRNSIGLEKCEGFMNNTNYLLPWILAKVTDPQKKEQAALKNSSSSADKKAIDANEWPLPGKSPEIKSKSTSSPLTNLEAFPALGTIATTARGTTSNIVTAPVTTVSSSLPDTKKHEETTTVPKKERRRRDGRRRDREHRLEGLIRGYVGAEYECPHGHRFLSCGDGRICKIGHKGHPKDHGNYFVHQDVPLYVPCPCNFATPKSTTASPEIISQLQRLYVVTPDSTAVTVSMKPRIKIVDSEDQTFEFNLGFENAFTLPRNSLHVLRLPYIYTTPSGDVIPNGPEVGQRLKNAVLLKECFQVHEQIGRQHCQEVA